MFPPSTPGSVFKTDTVGNLVLETGHVAPGPPDVLFTPVVGEIVDLTTREVGQDGVVGDDVDTTEEEGKIVGHGGGGGGGGPWRKGEDGGEKTGREWRKKGRVEEDK